MGTNCRRADKTGGNEMRLVSGGARDQGGRIMAHAPHAQMDQTVLEMIEHSPVGAVPHTPTYQDALRRLLATHQAYASADHKDGHVTVRSLAASPLFHAGNLAELAAGRIEAGALEANAAIFDRYAASLPAALRAKAEPFKVKVTGRAVQHRKHAGAGEAAAPDPVRSVFLVPGTGPHPGLPGNYLYGALDEVRQAGGASAWTVSLHDADDGAAMFEAADLAAALAALQDVLASAPFQLSELAALGFKAN